MSKEPERPSFDAPLWAALRQGDKELGQTLPATRESIRVVEEPGTLGNPTQQMVTEQAQGKTPFQRLIDRYDSGAQDRGPEQGMER